MLSSHTTILSSPLSPTNKKRKRGGSKITTTMALEACSFQLSSTAPAASSLNTRASCILREKKLNLATNRGPRRALSSSPLSSSPSPSSSIPFNSLGRSGQGRTSVTCQATNIVNEVVEVTDNSWDELVLGSEIPALVEFWAPSCGPCKMVAPVMDELAKEYAGKIACFKINTDDSLKMASKYGIQSIPTVLIFKNGNKQETVTSAGAVKKSALSATIDKYVEV